MVDGLHTHIWNRYISWITLSGAGSNFQEGLLRAISPICIIRLFRNVTTSSPCTLMYSNKNGKN
jgi:hypothetical protein